MSDLPAPLPDPSQPESQAEFMADREPGPQPGPVPSHESPDVEMLAAQITRGSAAGLSDSQRTVMTYLAAGNSIAKAARLGNVNRRTVFRWLKDDAHFAAVYNAWRKELEQSAKTRALAMCDDALDTIHNAILGGDVKASLALTKSVGVLAKQRIGSDDPQRIAHKRRLHKMRRIVAEEREIHDARYGLPAAHPLCYTPEERAKKEEDSRRWRQEHEKSKQDEPEWRGRLREAREQRKDAGESPQSPPQQEAAPPAEPQVAPPKKPDEPEI